MLKWNSRPNDGLASILIAHNVIEMTGRGNKGNLHQLQNDYITVRAYTAAAARKNENQYSPYKQENKIGLKFSSALQSFTVSDIPVTSYWYRSIKECYKYTTLHQQQ